MVLLSLFFLFFGPCVLIWDELRAGFGEETFEPNEGDKGAEARPQHLRW